MLGDPLDEWAHRQGLRPVFVERDISSLLANGRAAAIFDRIHSAKSRDLGNVVAFIEMYLGRGIRVEEHQFGTLCVTDFGLHPFSVFSLIAFSAYIEFAMRGCAQARSSLTLMPIRARKGFQPHRFLSANSSGRDPGPLMVTPRAMHRSTGLRRTTFASR